MKLYFSKAVRVNMPPTHPYDAPLADVLVSVKTVANV